MTFREKLREEHPEFVCKEYIGGCLNCPMEYGYESKKPANCLENPNMFEGCEACWNREYTPTTEKHEQLTSEKSLENPTGSKLKDSGNRTDFGTGAVRDMDENKGRCDLLPLDVIARLQKIFLNGFILPDLSHYPVEILSEIDAFQETGDTDHLFSAVASFIYNCWYDTAKYMPYAVVFNTAMLELAKHFQDGAKKYSDNNWKNGIPVKFYIDSALRHFFKYCRYDSDEPHDRAFIWNIVCAIWTCWHKPELNDYRRVKEDDKC